MLSSGNTSQFMISVCVDAYDNGAKEGKVDSRDDHSVQRHLRGLRSAN
jgi:hypothetical protein